MRGLFSAGVIDVMMEHNIYPDALVGVSAGAAFGCNMKSRQAGRAIRYNKRFARDARYSGWRSLVKSGDYFNAEFAYHIVPRQYDVFDDEAFNANRMQFCVVCTDVETGQPVYKWLYQVEATTYDWIRASASMPLVSRVVSIDGYQLLDGGISDSIPLEYIEKEFSHRNVVVLTQPRGYRKEHNRLMPLMRLALHKYPRLIEALDRRHEMYNRQLDYVAEAERQGRCLVISPDAPLPIGHTCHNPEQMQCVYDIGRRMGERYLDRIRDFYIWGKR